MLGIVLAAGIGKRLRPITESIPKALVPLDGYRIIDLIVCNLVSLGIKNIIFVTGHGAEKLKKYINETYPQIQPSYVHNPVYNKTNTAYSLLLALRSDPRDNIIIINGDVIADYRIYQKIYQEGKTALVVDDKKELTPESFKVMVDESGRIVALGKWLDPQKSIGEYIGISTIMREHIAMARASLEKLVSKDKNSYYDLLYEDLAKHTEVSIVSTDGLLWTEVDFPEDLEYAKKIIHKIMLGPACSHGETKKEN